MAEHAHTTPAPMSAAAIPSRRRLISAAGTAALAGTAPVLAAPDAPTAEHPDASLIVMLAELDAIELEIYPPGFQGPERQGDWDAQVAPLRARQAALLGIICTTRAYTLDGMRARIRSITCMGNDLTDCLGDDDDPRQCSDDRMVLALLRDLTEGVAA